jgi:hypothetical protein
MIFISVVNILKAFYRNRKRKAEDKKNEDTEVAAGKEVLREKKKK